MTVTCDLRKKGPDIAKDIKSFEKNLNKAISPARLKKNKTNWNKRFQSYIKKNAQRAGIYETDFEKIFNITMVGDKIVISNTDPIVVNRYEYGWEDDIEDEANGEYATVFTPRYFVRPALEQLIEDILQEVERDVYSNYDKEARIGAKSEWQWTSSKEYLSRYSFNKYSGIYG